MTYRGIAALDRFCPKAASRPGLLTMWRLQSVFWRRPAWSSRLQFSLLAIVPGSCRTHRSSPVAVTRSLSVDRRECHPWPHAGGIYLRFPDVQA